MRPDTVLWRSADGVAHTAPDPALNPLVPGFVDIIDQTLLPGEFKRILLSEPRTVYDAIRRLAVRGAPAIGCAAALGLAACAQRFGVPGREEFLACLCRTAAYLESSRPTAVNLSWALRRCCAKTSECEGAVPELLAVLLNEALAILAEDIAMCDAIGRNGLTLLKDGMGVLTHCNAGALATGGCGTALAPVYAAQKAGLRLHVYSDETRPLLQGARLTSWELQKSGVDVTLICDNMASIVMKNGWIDAVVVGCDRMAANGDGANKIGTSGVAILAKEYGIPFYMYVPTSTIDLATPTGAEIPIELRKGEEIYEMWYEKPMAPVGVKTYNPSFDVTDHKYITAVITEKGIVRPPYDVNLRKLFEE